MTQAQVEAWIAQNGGPGAVQYAVEQKQVRNPSYNPDKGPRPGNEEYTSIQVETWKNTKTGANLSAKNDGSGTFEVYDNVSADPNKPATTTTSSRTAREEAEIAANAALPADQDPRSETNAERAARADARIKQQGADALAADERARRDRIDQQNAATAAASGRRADSAEARAVAEANRVGSKVESLTIGGKQYTRITKTSPDGKTTTIENFGPDGKAISQLPSEPPDNPTAPAPRLQNFVLGGSQAALTKYKDELQAGVSAGLWSQKWASDRWGEAIQTAQQVNRDYETQQRDIESGRNAEINLATSRATLGQNAIKSALDHVNKINGLLPEGSSLGGKSFAALLGLNMLMQARSGIDTIDPNRRPGQQQAPLPTITAADLRDPAAIETKRQQIMANPVFRPQPVAPPPTAPAPIAQPAVPEPTPANNPAAAGVTAPAPPQVSTVVGGASAVAEPPPEAMAPPSQNPYGPQPQEVGQPGDPVYMPPPPVSVAPYQDEQRGPGYGATIVLNPSVEESSAAGSATEIPLPPLNTLPGQVQPQSTPGNVVPQSRAGASAYPVLSQYQPPSMTVPAPSPAPKPSAYPVMANYGQPQAAAQPPQASQPQYPAVLHSEAASKVPWQMTPERIQEMINAGVPEDVIWSVPGRAA